MQGERTICEVCEQPALFRWTDTHGIGACTTCGTTYRLYHYEGGGRVEKPPAICFLLWYIPFARRYWQEEHRNVDPGACNFPGSSYEVATHEDFATYRAWVERNRTELDAAQAAYYAAHPAAGAATEGAEP